MTAIPSSEAPAQMSLDWLPEHPSPAQARELIKSAPLRYWIPVLDHLQQAFGLPGDQWSRIPEGSNALFELGDDVIVKLVPPNWRQQVKENSSSRHYWMAHCRWRRPV